MKLTMIGAGYVGLVSGACFSEYGFDVVCVDTNTKKIKDLQAHEIPIFEPGLDQLVKRNADAGRLTFTTDFDEAVKSADVVFIAVGTPSRRGDGEADLDYVFAAAKGLAKNLKPGGVVVTKSTVVVGTNEKVYQIIKQERPDLVFSVASNPEFLREGSAIDDFMRPDRVVVGVHDARGKEVMSTLYRPLSLRETPIVFTNLENAELIKYAANAFLAMKITFINEIADLCEKVGGDVQQVASAIGLDNRIGSKFLHAGPGFGGSCFPKDTRALAATARKHDSPLQLIDSVIEINESRKEKMAAKILLALGEETKGKIVAVLGVAFKPNTDDVREAPSLTVIRLLQAAGCSVRATDPEAMGEAAKILENVTWCEDAYEAAARADALVIVTEWNAFRSLDLTRLKETMHGDIFIDLRNIYPPDEITKAGFIHYGVGR